MTSSIRLKLELMRVLHEKFRLTTAGRAGRRLNAREGHAVAVMLVNQVLRWASSEAAEQVALRRLLYVVSPTGELPDTREVQVVTSALTAALDAIPREYLYPAIQVIAGYMLREIDPPSDQATRCLEPELMETLRSVQAECLRPRTPAWSASPYARHESELFARGQRDMARRVLRLIDGAT